MGKNDTRHLPPELKGFWRLFSSLCYRWDYSKVFEAFVFMCLNWFADGIYKEERDRLLSPYDKEEKQVFNLMFTEMIKAQNELLKKHDWFDFLGTIYENLILSRGKSSILGQFFTPAPVVDIMVQMQGIGKGEDLKISDPAAGSGRFLIACHAHNPKNFCFAADIDLICCYMCVVNFMMHGCRGEIVWRNSLVMQDYKKGWKVEYHPVLRLPYVQSLCKEDSFIYAVDNPKQQLKQEYCKSENQEEFKQKVIEFKPEKKAILKNALGFY